MNATAPAQRDGVARGLEELPETADALKSGSISFSAVRELSRVAVPATEREWLDAAAGRTVREVEALVSGHRPGSLPDAPQFGSNAAAAPLGL